jgi:phosphate transport system substrate-binding protein
VRNTFARLSLIGLLALPLLTETENAAATDVLRFGGTGSSIGMLRRLGADFTAATGVKVDVVSSLGSSGGIYALADGKLDLTVSARPLKPEEAAAGLSQALVLRTPYVLATSHRNPNGLKTADLPGIFTAGNPTWSDGTPIRIILRPRSETDTALLGELFPGLSAAIEKARQRPEIPIAATDQDNLALALRMPGSLVGTTLTQIETEHRNLQVIALDGVAPTLANFESGAYKFTKKLYFILGGKNAATTQQFVTFLCSPQGVKALHAVAVLPDNE